MTARAERVLDASPERIYAFLAELHNHWRLGDDHLRLEWLRPDGLGGRISVGTRWGLRRTAATAVTTAVPSRHFGGTAVARGGTHARVRWTLEPRERGTLVALEATVFPGSALDRLLLALGGRRWLEGRFDRAVAALGRALDRARPAEAASS